MRICIISDTHNKHKQLILPLADIIIHCGDMTSVGKEYEIRNFFSWYSKLNQYKYKICIAGNHDWLFETSKLLAKSLVPKNVIYLEDNEVIIDGIKFYGTPVQKPFCNWAFNRSEEKLIQHWLAIPDDVNVLITHESPYMDFIAHNDVHVGSPSLYFEVINRIKPLIHTMGHIHSNYGINVVNNITFVNASNLDDNYNCVNKPILLELINNTVNVIDY
jgi:Icc-related predicted phosphoesterase